MNSKHASLTAEAREIYSELLVAIMDAETGGQIGEILKELEDSTLTEKLGTDAVELGKHD